MKPKEALSDLIALDEVNKGRFSRNKLIARFIQLEHLKNKHIPRLDEYYKLYEAGLSAREIGEMVDVEPTWLTERFKEYGYPLRARGRRVGTP